MSLIYFGLGYLTLRANRDDRYLIMTFLGVALTFLTIAIPIQLQGRWITIAWAVEGFLLFWIGFSLNNIRIRQAAWIVSVLLTFRLFVFESNYPSELFNLAKVYLPVLNLRGLTFLFGLGAIWGGSFLYAKYKGKTNPIERRVATILALLGNLVLLFFLSTENSFYWNTMGNHTGNQIAWLNDARQLTLSGIWGLYSIILIIIGIMKRFQPIRIFAMLLFALTILKVFLFDLSGLQAGYRIISFIGLGIILILVSYLYHRYQHLFLNLTRLDEKEEDSKP
jgi:uncharacterized membrane protein